MMHVTATEAEKATGILVLAAVVGFLFFMAGARIPDLHVADQARAALAAITATGIILGSLALIGIGIRHARPATIGFGILFAFIALPVAGITVGLPAFLVPIVGLLNAFVAIINGILGFLGGFRH